MGFERKLGRDQTFKRQKLAKTRQRRETLDAERGLAELGGRVPRNDLLPTLEVRMMPLSELQPSLHRVRKSTPEQLKRVASSIADLGFWQPILVRGNEIVDGQIRFEAASQLGLNHVPTIDCAHLSKSEVRKLRLALNRTAELGEWDLDLLKIEFQELIDLDVDLSSTGFSAQEQEIILLDPLYGEGGDEEFNELPLQPVTRLGDIWQLAGHRVICGSALEPRIYELLLEGVGIHAVIADAPYNVRIAGNVSGLGKTKHDEFAMASGEMSDREFQDFLNAVMACLTAHLLAGSVLFGFMDWRSIHRLYQAGFASQLTLLNLIVWYKQTGAMGGFYRSAHELIAVLCKGDAPRTNNIQLGRHGRDRSNVVSMPGANRRGSSANEMLGLHATPKPVELCVDLILDVTNRGEVVFDPFLGSGTTLIAAEKTGRQGFGIELEPGFVDVSIARWERLTGQRAVLAQTGETFAAVAGRRIDAEPSNGTLAAGDEEAVS